MSKKGNNIDEEMGRLRISSYEHPNNFKGFALTPEELAFYQQQAGKYSLALIGEVIDDREYQDYKKIAETQRYDSELNDRLKNVIRKQLRNARNLAFEDLRNHKKYGRNVRDSEEQYLELLNKAQERSMGR